MEMIQEIDTGSDTPHFPETHVDNNSQETMAALHGLEHHNQRETVLAVPADGPILRRMRTEHRMSECSLAEKRITSLTLLQQFGLIQEDHFYCSRPEVFSFF